MDSIFQQTHKPAPSGGVVHAYLGAGAVPATPWLDADGKHRVRINAPGGGIKSSVPPGTPASSVVWLYLVNRPREYGTHEAAPTVVGRTIEVRAHDRTPVPGDDGRVRALWVEYYAHRDGCIAEFPWTKGTQTMSIEDTVDGHGRVNRLIYEGGRYASPEDMLADEAVSAANRERAEAIKRTRDPAVRQAEMAREIAAAVAMATRAAQSEDGPRSKGAR